MNTRQLEMLRAVLSTGSATAAAKILGISQSGVSRLLQQLEEDLQLVLFIREKGRLIATPEAMKLSYDVNHILSGVDRFSNLARDLRSGNVGPDFIRFGLPHSMAEVFTSNLLAMYAKDFPAVRLETFFDTEMANIRHLEQRTLDFAFVREEGNENPQIQMDHVLRSSSVCVMHPDHPLAAMDSIGPKDLRDTPLILIGSRRPTRIAVDNIFHRARIPQNIAIETHSNGSACAYAANGLGVAIITGFFANLFVNLPIATRPFIPAIVNNFSIATATGVPLSIATAALIKMLRAEVLRRDAAAASA